MHHASSSHCSLPPPSWFGASPTTIGGATEGVVIQRWLQLMMYNKMFGIRLRFAAETVADGVAGLGVGGIILPVVVVADVASSMTGMQKQTKTQCVCEIEDHAQKKNWDVPAYGTGNGQKQTTIQQKRSLDQTRKNNRREIRKKTQRQSAKEEEKVEANSTYQRYVSISASQRVKLKFNNKSVPKIIKVRFYLFYFKSVGAGMIPLQIGRFYGNLGKFDVLLDLFTEFIIYVSLRMVLLGMRLSCCTSNREISNRMDIDQPPDRIMTYDGLESCILNANNSYEDESVASKGDGCPTDSPSSCCSSNNPSGSFFSQWSMMKRDEHEWDYAVKFTDVDVMKEKFAKLLLGEDTTGGRNGVSPALALSNAITNLAGTVFGELWKLEPLPDEKKNKWRRELDWLLSPTNYMVQLIPAKQCGPDGRTIEIMTPKARGDVHLNLPALQKLDSMLLETLDSMTETEFWYDEGGSRAEGRSKRWWLPAPQVPVGGLSDIQRKKLHNQAKLVLQIFKAAKSINETILLEMPIPKIISDVLPKSGKESLGEDLYRILNRGSSSACDMLNSLSLKSENSALDAINRLEAAIYAWKDKIDEHDSGKSPARTSWSCKDTVSELDKIELLITRAESLSREIKTRFPDLPQRFLDVMKIQYGKDVAHAIIEAYSRVLGNLAFSILTRIGDISQEDVLSDPNASMATNSTQGVNSTGSLNIKTRHALIDKMDSTEGKLSSLKTEAASYTATPSTSSGCCLGKEAYLDTP
ncbi:hypothetical protein L1987_26187 [Smallanthus sonchifolius]|uniref:Uncharacterized protein n=1 Tax=Smallanthus sonchifolius TaxID=185202 RepID=A0ACB9I977_9ASTR|nr:hypothetical protein L1987_26187 [Smallanthus sonchifolius]